MAEQDIDNQKKPMSIPFYAVITGGVCAGIIIGQGLGLHGTSILFGAITLFAASTLFNSLEAREYAER